MKTAIIYESKHHGNTKKVCDAIAEACDVTLFDATEAPDPFPWAEYDLIGFASGIAYKKYYENVTLIAGTIPSGKEVFFIYTCARNDSDFSSGIRAVTEKNGAKAVGTYGCKGFNTYGPLKLIGGMNKLNPTEDELQEAVRFYKEMEAIKC